MRDVNVEARLVLEGHDEAVGESLCFVVGCNIGAPLVVGDGLDFLGERGEFLFDVSDLGLGGVVFVDL